MAGQVTVKVELEHGTVVERTYHWTGGNENYEGLEAEGAGKAALSDVVTAVRSVHGSLRDYVSPPSPRPGKLK